VHGRWTVIDQFVTARQKTADARAPAPFGRFPTMAAARPQKAPGLKGMQRHVLLNKMFRIATDSGEQLKCAVVDDEGRCILNQCFLMSEVVEAGVTHVENLLIPRQYQPQLGAIYFVAPSEGSIRRVLADFQGGKAGKVRYAKLYPEAWIFFTKRVPDELFSLIQQEMASNPTFQQSVALCRELNMEFVPLPTVSTSTFSLRLPEMFAKMYRPRTSEEKARGDEEYYDRVVDRLFELCITMGENPEIVYFSLDERSKSKPSRVAEDEWRQLQAQHGKDMNKIAQVLRDKLDKFAADTCVCWLTAHVPHSGAD
jgi:hypothetical protein